MTSYGSELHEVTNEPLLLPDSFDSHNLRRRKYCMVRVRGSCRPVRRGDANSSSIASRVFGLVLQVLECQRGLVHYRTSQSRAMGKEHNVKEVTKKTCVCGNAATYFVSPTTNKPITRGMCALCYEDGVRRITRDHLDFIEEKRRLTPGSHLVCRYEVEDE